MNKKVKLMNKISNKLLFIQLNEINFDLVEAYLTLNDSKNYLSNIKFLINNYTKIETYSEDEYENLEPWIQWVSVHLGKKFKEHKIFRLGDIVKHAHQTQIFEYLENKGYTVGAVSPMNTDNRLKNPDYFIPDPWTKTNSDHSVFSKNVTKMLQQSVNDNSSGKLSVSSIMTIMQIFFKTFSYKNSTKLINLIFFALIEKWKKSLVLDYIIHLVNFYFLKKKKPDFATVFFNAGAHIQHHYYFNSKNYNSTLKNPDWYIKNSIDPIEYMLKVYDEIIGDYLKFCQKNNYKIIIATGLRQVPYDKVKFYYRLKNHSLFLKEIGVNFSHLYPRMTRDFEIIFQNNDDLLKAKKILAEIRLERNNTQIFKDIEERSKSLFVTLTYPDEIKKNDKIIYSNQKYKFFNKIVFVAIKNGMHDPKGYVFMSPQINFKNFQKKDHVSKIYKIIEMQFN
jgi:hypothetical protein